MLRPQLFAPIAGMISPVENLARVQEHTRAFVERVKGVEPSTFSLGS